MKIETQAFSILTLSIAAYVGLVLAYTLVHPGFFEILILDTKEFIAIPLLLFQVVALSLPGLCILFAAYFYFKSRFSIVRALGITAIIVSFIVGILAITPVQLMVLHLFYPSTT